MTLINFLENNQLVFISIIFVVGMVIGSFLNVVIYRLPLMMERSWREQCSEYLDIPDPQINPAMTEVELQPFNLVTPNSHCPQCKNPVRPWQNIPVISYLILLGKCGYCRQKISVRYPLIEIITAALSGLLAWQFGISMLLLATLILTWCLVVLTMIDIDHQLLPDSITLPLLWLGLLLSTLDIGLGISSSNAVIGAIAGYLILWSVYQGFKFFTGKEGMGFGDFKLLAALGAWLGWQSLMTIVILSSLVGAAVGIFLHVFLGRDKNIPIPFGPYLAGAGFITLLGGEQISRLYLNLLAF